MVAKGKTKLADKQHPLYVDNVANWKFYLDAVKGGKNMLNSTQLFSHRLEDTTDHASRVDRAYYLNQCSAIISAYNSYIFREPIQRIGNKDLTVFRSNTDSNETSINDFIDRAGFLASTYGAIHALTDINSSSKKNISKRDVRNGVLAPYSTLILPSQLRDWSVDSKGQLRWIIIESTYYRDEDPSLERITEKHYKLISREGWHIENEDGDLVILPDGELSKGENKLGFIPLTTMYHTDIDNDRVGESLLKDISFVNRAILNWCSCIDEQIDRQTFSQLIIPDDGSLAQEEEASGVDPLVQIGTGSAFTFPVAAGHPPAFISPNTHNIEVIWKLVANHIKEMFRMAGLIGGTGDLHASQSGKASQIGFQGVNSTLAKKAALYQKFENDISKVALLQLGISEDKYEATKYPETFDIASLSDEIDSYFKVMEAGFSKTLNTSLQKNIARRALPLASQLIKETIETEIDAGEGVIKSSSSSTNGKKLDEGNPNVPSLSDTFRTVEDVESDEITKMKKEES